MTIDLKEAQLAFELLNIISQLETILCQNTIRSSSILLWMSKTVSYWKMLLRIKISIPFR